MGVTPFLQTSPKYSLVAPEYRFFCLRSVRLELMNQTTHYRTKLPGVSVCTDLMLKAIFIMGCGPSCVWTGFSFDRGVIQRQRQRHCVIGTSLCEMGWRPRGLGGSVPGVQTSNDLRGSFARVFGVCAWCFAALCPETHVDAEDGGSVSTLIVAKRIITERVLNGTQIRGKQDGVQNAAAKDTGSLDPKLRRPGKSRAKLN